MSDKEDKDPDGGIAMEGREKAKKKLDEWTNVHGNNFFGTGMTFHEFTTYGAIEKFKRCLHRQDSDERRRRMTYVIELGAIIKELEDRDIIFATGLMTGWIEAIIEGDLKHLQGLTKHFQKPDGIFSQDYEHTDAPELYRKFHRLIESCVETWPEDKDD